MRRLWLWYLYMCLVYLACLIERRAAAGAFVAYYDANVPDTYRSAAALALSTVGNFLILATDVNVKFKWGVLSVGILGDTTAPNTCQDPNHLYVIQNEWFLNFLNL